MQVFLVDNKWYYFCAIFLVGRLSGNELLLNRKEKRQRPETTHPFFPRRSINEIWIFSNEMPIWERGKRKMNEIKPHCNQKCISPNARRIKNHFNNDIILLCFFLCSNAYLYDCLFTFHISLYFAGSKTVWNVSTIRKKKTQTQRWQKENLEETLRSKPQINRCCM